MTDVSNRLSAALADRYHIERELGVGGMATVYLARDLKHDRDVALKVLRPDLAQSLGSERFVREIRLAARLTHPHILPLYDSGEADGFLYYVMPLIEGESLRDRITKTKQLAIDEAVQVARDIADALDYAHRHDVVHRDIKPENILLHDGHAVVADFGIGKAVTAAAGGETITETGVTIGTPAYMSPEQAAGDASVDGRSDLYSLGCLMYEALTGEPPFTGPTAQAIIAKRFSVTPPQVTVSRHAVPEWVSRAIAKLLAREPADRYATGAELLAVLKSAGSAAQTAKAGEKSIAVLPFTNMSADAENEYFSDGITEEIINALVQLPDLRVAARTSGFAFKGKAVDLRAIADKLGVRTVLEGSVRKAGNRIRITAQLVNAADGYHLWSEHYDRELTDVFAVQDEIARTIAQTLKVKLGGAEQAPLVRPPTSDVEAYELYLKGRYFWAQRGAGIRKGLEYFQAALRKDPDYALAHAGLADAYTLMAFYGYARPTDAMPQALAAAERALALDASLAEAHCSLGFIRLSFDWNLPEAEREFREAIALKPSHAPSHYWHAASAIARGDPLEAVARDERAVKLEPLSVFTNTHLGWMLLAATRFDDARQRLDYALELDPRFLMAHWLLGQTLVAQGQVDEGRAALRNAIEISAGHSGMVATLGVVCAASGQRKEARLILEDLRARSEREYVRAYLFALLHASLGDAEETFVWLAKALEERDTVLPYAHLDFPLPGMMFRSDVTNDPRFVRLMARRGMIV